MHLNHREKLTPTQSSSITFRGLLASSERKDDDNDLQRLIDQGKQLAACINNTVKVRWQLGAIYLDLLSKGWESKELTDRLMKETSLSRSTIMGCKRFREVFQDRNDLEHILNQAFRVPWRLIYAGFSLGRETFLRMLADSERASDLEKKIKEAKSRSSSVSNGVGQDNGNNISKPKPDTKSSEDDASDEGNVSRNSEGVAVNSSGPDQQVTNEEIVQDVPGSPGDGDGGNRVSKKPTLEHLLAKVLSKATQTVEAGEPVSKNILNMVEHLEEILPKLKSLCTLED